jgi:hypothetical protein
MSGSSNIPARNAAFQSPDGSISPAWWDFLFRQWKKTGGGTPSGGSFVLKTGDSMTGPLVLSGDPALPLHAADKSYVDGQVVHPFAGVPHAIGTAAPGSSALFARGDHVHAYPTVAAPPTANLATIVATAETALWSPAAYTPIMANTCSVGRVYRIVAGGVMSFAAAGTLTITPRYGLSTAGVSMGPSVAQTSPGATVNQPWRMEMDVVCRSVGAGATSKVIGAGMFATSGLGTAGTSVAFAFGGLEATVDLTVAGGICIGWTLTTAGSVTPQYVAMTVMN